MSTISLSCFSPRLDDSPSLRGRHERKKRTSLDDEELRDNERGEEAEAAAAAEEEEQRGTESASVGWNEEDEPAFDRETIENGIEEKEEERREREKKREAGRSFGTVRGDFSKRKL